MNVLMDQLNTVGVTVIMYLQTIGQLMLVASAFWVLLPIPPRVASLSDVSGIQYVVHSITARLVLLMCWVRFPHHDWFFLAVSQASDPLITFLYVVPLVAGLRLSLGADMLVTTALGEWFNTLLKWMLMEDRPYWWVRETPVYGGRAPVLRQTPLTCETGPGSPSGHVMGYGAVAYVLAAHLCKGAPRSTAAAVWALYWSLVLLVSLSRLYVATHFPHQCVLGALGGVFVAWLLMHPDSPVSWWRYGSRPALLLLSLFLCTAAVAAYWLQKLLGVDPQWSVRLAFKWCERPEFLHVNTTPLFSLVRSCGALLGITLCAPLAIRLRGDSGWALRLAGSLLLAVGFQQVTQLVPTHNAALFYTAQFLLHATQPYLLLILVPRLVSPSLFASYRRANADER